jgi:hypothetical protein
MSFEVRTRFQVDEDDLAKALGAYRKVHKILRAAPDAPLAVELLRVVGDAHSFEERLAFRDRAHFEGSFAVYRRANSAIDEIYRAIPCFGVSSPSFLESAAPAAAR